MEDEEKGVREEREVRGAGGVETELTTQNSHCVIAYVTVIITAQSGGGGIWESVVRQQCIHASSLACTATDTDPGLPPLPGNSRDLLSALGRRLAMYAGCIESSSVYHWAGTCPFDCPYGLSGETAGVTSHRLTQRTIKAT